MGTWKKPHCAGKACNKEAPQQEVFQERPHIRSLVLPGAEDTGTTDWGLACHLRH